MSWKEEISFADRIDTINQMQATFIREIKCMDLLLTDSSTELFNQTYEEDDLEKARSEAQRFESEIFSNATSEVQLHW